MNELKYVNIRKIEYLLSGYKDVMVSRFMYRFFREIIEDLNNVISIEVHKISPKKWQVMFIVTEENSYNLEGDRLFLSPYNYHLKYLTKQVEIYQYNPFFGIRKERVCEIELKQFPDEFLVFNEYGEEIPQQELQKL